MIGDIPGPSRGPALTRGPGSISWRRSSESRARETDGGPGRCPDLWVSPCWVGGDVATVISPNSGTEKMCKPPQSEKRSMKKPNRVLFLTTGQPLDRRDKGKRSHWLRVAGVGEKSVILMTQDTAGFNFIEMKIKFRNSWVNSSTFTAWTLDQFTIWGMMLVPRVFQEAMFFHRRSAGTPLGFDSFTYSIRRYWMPAMCRDIADSGSQGDSIPALMKPSVLGKTFFLKKPR